MAHAPSCTLYPKVNGKDSKLYKGMLEKKKLSRPKTNYLYARYKVFNIGDAMDKDPNINYKRNSQGEHNYDEYLRFINYSDWEKEADDITTAELQIGAIDSFGKRIDFTSASDALNKADEFNYDPAGNAKHKALVAYVVSHGDMYNIVIGEKTAETHLFGQTVRNKIKIWEELTQAFNTIGVDLENMPAELSSTFSADHATLINDIINFQKTSFEHLQREHALALLSMFKNSGPVNNVVNKFGSIENAAQAIYEFNYQNRQLTTPEERLLRRAITFCQQFQGLDLNALHSRLSQISQQLIANDPETLISQEIKKLNKQYGITSNEVHRIGTKINKLSEAAADAVFVLERRIREIENKKGSTVESKRLGAIKSQLMRELNNKKYYSGIIAFLKDASVQIADIDNILTSAPTTGTEIEKIFAAVKAIQDIKTIKNQYYDLITALAREGLDIDESIGATDIDNIRQTAQGLKEYFDRKQEMLNKLTMDNMRKLLREVVGKALKDGMTIEHIIELASVDSSKLDFLYSVGRASNPVIAAMGSIIRKAQAERDPIMNAMAMRIRRSTFKLHKSGSSSEYMYDDDGYIISDIDWKAYQEARDKENKKLYAKGLNDFDRKIALEQWENLNTEDRVVDVRTGRTEKVPDKKYRKKNGLTWNYNTNTMDFTGSSYTKAQETYYNEMMQLKGEIGTLLPVFAQNHYLPPQLRRSMMDAISKAKSADDVRRAIGRKVADKFIVREDDTNFYRNGIIEGEPFTMTRGDYKNQPVRQIPIFYINKVEQKELLKEFSTGLQALAATAINYEAMNNIVDVVEFMGDFVKDASANGRDKKKKSDVVAEDKLRVIKDLVKWARNTNNDALIDGFISKHIYGMGIDPDEKTWLTKFWNNIIGYTSFRGLSTNVKGAFSNYLVGEYQMLIEAGCGEFYGFKDYLWAHDKLFGGIGAMVLSGEKALQGAGIGGELAELLSNNMNHKATLLREKFDPVQENFLQKSHTKYYNSMFRQLLSVDCSFIGYASGEWLIHYVNMYAVLHNKKVKLNGKEISLYDAYEVTNSQDGNSELHLKKGVTDMNGNALTDGCKYEEDIRGIIRYVNQSTHGSMNAEDKGLIHRYWWGRGVMNFRQWMVEHYSRRFRGRHFDDSLQQYREGYWTSYWNYLANDEVKDKWNDKQRWDASKDVMVNFMKDWYCFILRSQAAWDGLDDMQKANIGRVHTEMMIFAALLGLSLALGEPDEHKKEFWHRWWIYQVKRMMLDAEASMPHPKAISSGLTILQSPMGGIDTMNSLLYVYYGLANGDILKEVKSGPNKGQNRYWRNIKMKVLPFFKDWEQMKRLDEDNSIFKIFDDSPSRY